MEWNLQCELCTTDSIVTSNDAYCCFWPLLKAQIKQDRQASLKAKYSPRAIPVQHFVNPGQAVSRTQETQKTHVTIIYHTLLI